MANLLDQRSGAFEKVLDFFQGELHNIRSGRASTGIVDSIPVEAYGSTMELKGVASISVPDARTIQIEPWDKGLVGAIEKAIQVANIGMQPNTTGTTIRLNLPPMTEENRKAIVKQVHEKAEHARISIRKVREEIRDEIAKSEKEKEISEDDKHRLQEELDKRVKEWNEKIETVAGEKEKEVMTI